MNRRAFLTGLLAAAAVPALPAQAVSCIWEGSNDAVTWTPIINVCGIPETQLQLEMARRVAEHWQRQIHRAFVLQMEQCWK